MNKANQIYQAPMQSLFDVHMRGLYSKHFQGIDLFFTPWISNSKKNFARKFEKEINSEFNVAQPICPQIVTSNAQDFLQMSELLHEKGFGELNWNLGCPYPMLTKKGLAAGLLPHPDKICEILDEVLPKIKCALSLKVRSGLHDPQELRTLLPLLDQYPLKEIIIHPRTADQMYKGKASHDDFSEFQKLTKQELVYNGDIVHYQDFIKIQERFPNINKWMIGRGLLINPFLPEMIKAGSDQLPANHQIRLEAFLMDSFEFYLERYNGYHHIHLKMIALWEYIAQSCADPHKALKAVKKANNEAAYRKAVQLNLQCLSY